MVAAWIRIGTGLAGDTALGVRLLGPLSAAAGSWLLLRAGEDLVPGAGLRAAVLFNATLVAAAGAVTMTPDTPLILFWIAALWAAAQVLRDGDLLGIFPEGAITRDGELQEFKGGVMKILERAPVAVIPMALTNLWGSFFSRIEQGGAMVRPFRRGMFNRVGLNVGAPLPAAEVQPALLRERVAGLLQISA